MFKKIKTIYYFMFFENDLVKKIRFKLWFYKTKDKREQFVKSNLKIQSISKTINEIIVHKKSISRFGDGELRLIISNKGLVFQPFNESLTKRLVEVLQSNLINHIVAMPQPIASVKEFTYNNKYWWINYLNSYGNLLVNYINFNKIYGNSFMSRFYLDFENKSNSINIVNQLKQIWHNQKILIVEGEFSRLGVGNDLFNNALQVNRVICPVENAYNKYDEIFAAVKKYSLNSLILIALGPTATVLAFDLAKQGFWALDVGHIDVEYMWMLQNAQTKVPIKGRYVAEAKSVIDYEIPLEDYNLYSKSILFKI